MPSDGGRNAPHSRLPASLDAAEVGSTPHRLSEGREALWHVAGINGRLQGLDSCHTKHRAGPSIYLPLDTGYDIRVYARTVMELEGHLLRTRA